MTERVGILPGEELLHVHDSQRPFPPPSGPATASFNDLHHKSKILAIMDECDLCGQEVCEKCNGCSCIGNECSCGRNDDDDDEYSDDDGM